MKKRKATTRFALAGDVGGTKTRLGLFRPGKTRPRAEVIETYPSKEATDLESLLARFLEAHRKPVKAACFGIPGPVVNGRSKTTNLPWTVSANRIQTRFGWSVVRLINDLAATAYAIPLLRPDEWVSLNRGKAHRGGNIALVAPGTGLGQALLIRHEAGHTSVASEGGHVDFAPQTEDQVDLWRHLTKRFGHVSIERLVSGPGLANIYQWLATSGRYQEPSWLQRAIRNGDPARVISETALTQKQPLCVAALDLFVEILGAVAGNLALTGLSMGGLYLGGGIPPKILPQLMTKTFMRAFAAKGRFQELLERMPVRVILNDRAALLGAAQCAWNAS